MDQSSGKVKAIFLTAIEEHTPEQWPAFLDKACAGDVQLRAEVEKLLLARTEMGSFHEAPRPAPVATIEEPIGEPPGTVIGPYKLIQEIGEGGMGTVYMAQQTEPVKRLVALKLIKPGMDSRQVIARFEAERQALALMDHPNIAKVLDAGTAPTGRPYFVMELVKGAPLTKYCDEHRLTPRQRLELFVPVCQALQHAHQKGIIHRDIKPSNVLVALYDGKPVPKVIDFGVAKAAGQQLTERTLVTGFGAVVGTLEYMSPEQAEMNQLDIDTRSDIYSLGVLLYELLTGSTPLDKKRLKEAAMLEVLRIIREEEPPKPSTRLSTTDELPSVAANRNLEPKKLSGLVKGELDWIVMKCLEKDRNRRYETANGLAVDLLRYLADEPVQACPPSTWYRFRKLVRRNKRTVAVVVMMLMLALAGTAVSTWQAVRATLAEEQTSDALTQTREALDALTEDVVETMFTKQPKLGEKEKAFLRKLLGFYEKFTQQSLQSAEARFFRAKSYYTVAHLRGLLGEHRDAVAGFRQAESLLEKLLAEFPEEAQYRHKLARAQGNLGVELAKLGNQPDADTAFRRGIALRTKLVDDFPEDLKYQLELANNYNDLGFLRELQRNYPEAEGNYRVALDLKEKIVAAAPADDQPKYQTELARGLTVLGQLARKQEKYAQSEQIFRRAVEMHEKQMGKGGDTPRERQGLANCYSGLGIALAELKRMPEAEKTFRQALEVRRKLTDDYPGVLEYRRELANASGDFAYFLTLQKKQAAAEGPYRQTLELRNAIVAQTGAVPVYRVELAKSHHDLAWVLSVTSRPKEAESEWRAALELWQKLARDLPKVPDFQDGLAGTLTNLAKLHNQRGNFKAALTLLEKARTHSQAALDGRPKDPGFRESYRDHLVAMAQSRLGLTDHARLATTADELARFGHEPANDTFDAATMLASSVMLVSKDAAVGETKRKELAQNYGDRALALLRKAVERGFTDAARMKQDTRLEAIRARPEFQKLLATLEAKKGT
jgi:serine/threonine protein kinase/tetratricopeptide (TPR) repeat protein